MAAPITSVTVEVNWPTSPEEAVGNGARWLDRHVPGWYDGDEAERIWEGHIDLDLLDLANGAMCVIGQLVGVGDVDPDDAYRIGRDAGRRWDPEFNERKLGFNLWHFDPRERPRGVPDDVPNDAPYDFDQLTDAWKTAIQSRRDDDARRRRANSWWRRALRFGRYAT